MIVKNGIYSMLGVEKLGKVLAVQTVYPFKSRKFCLFHNADSDGLIYCFSVILLYSYFA